MADGIFRKKSLERIQSPEGLNDYVRVANPGVWLVLIAVIALLVGVVAWGIFGRLEVTAGAELVVEDGTAVCYFSADSVSSLPSDLLSAEGKEMLLRVDGKEYSVTVDATYTARVIETKEFALSIDGLSLSDGIYSCDAVIESIRPISFVLN